MYDILFPVDAHIVAEQLASIPGHCAGGSTSLFPTILLNGRKERYICQYDYQHLSLADLAIPLSQCSLAMLRARGQSFAWLTLRTRAYRRGKHVR